MLFFTIGLPRSGKSTLCDEWVKYETDIINNQFQPHINEDICEHVHIIKEDKPRVIVCADDIRIALHGCRWSSVAEETIHSIQGVMIRSLLNRGFDVLLDGTHTTQPSIERILSFRPNAQSVYINTDSETCIERAVETRQSDLKMVIERMRANLEKLCGGYVTAFTIERGIKDIRENMTLYNNTTVL